jgi:hypothetical protein
MNEIQKSYAIFIITVILIIVGIFGAYQAIEASLVKPAITRASYPPSGELNITSQSSVEMYYSGASSFTMKSNVPVDVYIYVTNPSNYNGIYEWSNHSVTQLSLSIPSNGYQYIIVTNPTNTTAFVKYNVTIH